MLDQIGLMIGFDYEIREVADGSFGKLKEDGTWDGAIQELMLKEADVAVGSMSVTAQRESVIDFTVPYYDLVGIAIMMKISDQPNSVFKFLTVLELNVWLAILGCNLFTG